MSLKSKRELLEVLRLRYLKASKVEQQKILDEFTCATGYHRKHAIRVLKNQVQVQKHHKGKTKRYKTIYRGEGCRYLNNSGISVGRSARNVYNPICQKP